MNASNNALIVRGRQRGPIATNAIRGVQAAYRSIAAIWIAHRDHAREIGQLHAFSDRDLRDLGLTRSDVAAIAKRTYRRGK